MKNLTTRALALAAATLLAACGGGGSDTTPKAGITSVAVFGDSLADVGTFGFKFTVQGTDSLVYPERVAQLYGQTLCPYFVAGSSGTTFTPNPTSGCTAYAIGKGRINNATAPSSPLSIITQLQTAAATTTYAAKDLVLIDGGGNDAADLIGAYLLAGRGSPASYSGLLTSLLGAGRTATLLGSPNGAVLAGGEYMVALADAFSAAITANALDKGATHVAILNIPSITNTPRLEAVLSGIAAASGGGLTGATARDRAEAVFKSWIEAFNARLASNFAGNRKVVVIDFYKALNDQVADPAQFALTNATTPACPVTGVGADGLPEYDFPICTATALSAAPPSGVTDPNWWKTYGFSDGFHPTPAGHQLVSQLISRALAQAGWL
ncbi:MAG: phospholipase [Rubrivivax sp.]|nr:MAG: phospholipase [Rubrivivax sp.]